MAIVPFVPGLPPKVFSLKKKKYILKLYFKDIPVNQVNEHKHLGIVLSDDLNWNKHLLSRLYQGGYFIPSES